MTSFTKRAMATAIPADLLTAALEAFAEMPADDRQSYEARAFRIFQLLEEQEETGDRALIAFVIQLRLEALARLHDDHGLRAWTLAMSSPVRAWNRGSYSTPSNDNDRAT